MFQNGRLYVAVSANFDSQDIIILCSNLTKNFYFRNFSSTLSNGNALDMYAPHVLILWYRRITPR